MFRWLALVVFAATLSVSAWQRSRAHREKAAISRRSESPGLIVGRLIVALPLFGSVLAYLASPGLMAWASVDLPTWLRWVGAALGAATVPTVYWVLSTLGSNVSETVLTKERHELVTSGPYRWVRHPLYGTGLALFLSVGLMAANAFLLLWTMVALISIRLVVVPREEAALVQAFGQEYQTYQSRTGSLFPRLWAGGYSRSAG
jgi:protein-S-isoprenylcysteine O-methyltransferase Ste14